MRKFVLALGLILWGLVASLGIIYLSQQNLKEFDPRLRLSSHLMDLDFERKLVNSLPNRSPNRSPNSSHPSAIIGPTIYHITQERCACNIVNDAHKLALNNLANNKGVKTIPVVLNSTIPLTQFVPSTPAVLVVGSDNELVYFGPYASGAGCLQSEGLVDDVLQNYLNAAPNFIPVIQTEANGCYCENAAII